MLSGDRAMLGRAITLIESRNPAHQRLAAELSLKLFPHSGNAFRIGITGVPGVGKSTFIEAFGCNLIRDGQKVAVLAVDPTSPLTGGSILGDKTRMAQPQRRRRTPSSARRLRAARWAASPAPRGRPSSSARRRAST